LNLTGIITAIILIASSFWHVTTTLPEFDDRSSESRDFSSWINQHDPMTGRQPIPGVTASAIIAVDITTDELLYAYNADQPVAPASTLKMITALTALTILEPDSVIQVVQGDLVDTQVYSNAQLQAGDQITVRDLLAGLMLPSGGDAANALARVAGSQFGPTVGQSPTSRFVEEMNRVASDLGMTGSNFVNPDGPDAPQQFSTARDLAIAGAAVLDDELLAWIVSSSGWTITVSGVNARTYTVNNTNDLLGAERVHGIKTGTTGQAGESIVLATRRETNQIITVVMGSSQRYADTLLLLQYLDERIRWMKFDASSDFPEVAGQAQAMGFVLAFPFVKPYLRSEADQFRAELTLLGPRPRGSLPVRWGHVVFLNDNEERYEVPVLRAGVSTN
jgi:D-alanyl-D-alanine carboxypeptidase